MSNMNCDTIRWRIGDVYTGRYRRRFRLFRNLVWVDLNSNNFFLLQTDVSSGKECAIFPPVKLWFKITLMVYGLNIALNFNNQWWYNHGKTLHLFTNIIGWFVPGHSNNNEKADPDANEHPEENQHCTVAAASTKYNWGKYIFAWSPQRSDEENEALML